MTDKTSAWRGAALAFVLALTGGAAAAQTSDYIVAVVNQELVTAAELQARLARVRAEAARDRATLPPAAQLRQQVLDALIDERVMVTNARESGARVEESEIDRAIANIAQQNQLTTPQLRERLRADGLDYPKFRANVKDQLLVERIREREVAGRIRISDAEVDAVLEQRRAGSAAPMELNIAQILITVPEAASEAVVAEGLERANVALRRVRGGEDFASVAREMSQDANREQGGAIGMRPVDRLPDLFVTAVQQLRPGEVTAQPLRSGAGFHVLRLIERQESGGFSVQQTRSRHILLRVSRELSAEAAARRLAQFKREIESGARTFEQVARQSSEDSSAAQGGDIGWLAPGQVVPEYEQVINALPIAGLSEPFQSRFGVHLVQVLERRQVTLDKRQLREQARNILRERKFEEAYIEWLRDLRGRAYVELREPPQ